ncbi:signal peptidase I [Microbacterium keratanolyticum]
MSAPPRPRTVRQRLVGSAWFHLALAFVVVGLVLSFIAKPYWVPSASMEQTLQIGDRVLVNRVAYVGTQPAVGDIIVFDADESWGAHSAEDANPLVSAARWLGAVSGFGPSGQHTLVKRVIAGPGQTVACCTAEGALLVDGVAIDEPYVYQDLPFTAGSLDCTTAPRSLRCIDSVTVPEDSYLVLGDNRGNSSDSAAQCRGATDADPTCWRWAHGRDVVGKVVAILWPIQRWAVP